MIISLLERIPVKFAMKFTDLALGRLIKRYKRFLVDVELPGPEKVTAHCPNTGSMQGCLAPGNSVLLSLSGNQGRKYPYTLEMIQVNGFWVGVNTARTNHLVREAMENGVAKEFAGFDAIRPEVKVGAGRLDFLLHRGKEKIYVEVKNCTLVEDGTAMFPDAVTSRGTRHLEDLARLRGEGHQAVIFFCVQRMDGDVFRPAAHIDPLYAATLAKVAGEGVQVLAYRAEVGPDEIRITTPLPVRY